MLMPTNHLQLEIVILTQICILEPGLGALQPCTEGQCKIAGWQHGVRLDFATLSFHS